MSQAGGIAHSRKSDEKSGRQEKMPCYKGKLKVTVGGGKRDEKTLI